MAYLVPSLTILFRELDTVWPNRDRRTDGWIGDARHCPGSSAHCADSAGRVHAIDVDKDGVDMGFVVGRLIRYREVIRYINFNRYQYHVRNDYEPRAITSGDPHLGWAHIEIERTDTARGYSGGFGIVNAGRDEPIVIPDLQIIPQSDWDHSGLVVATSDVFAGIGNQLDGYGTMIAQLRI